MCRQHSKRSHQDTLGLLLPYRSPTPALPDRPLPHAALKPYDMPDATSPPGCRSRPTPANAACTRRRASSWRSFRSGSRPVPGIAGPAGPGADPSSRAMNSLWRARATSYIAVDDRAGAQHLGQRVHGPMVGDDPAVRIFSRTSSSSRPGMSQDFMAVLTGDLLTGRTAGSPG